MRKRTSHCFKIPHVCLSVHVGQLGSHWTDFHEVLYLNASLKSVEKIEVSLKCDKNNG